MPGNLIERRDLANGPCGHTGHITTCPDCRDVEPMVTNPRELSWMRRHLPANHRVLMNAIRDGSAIITQEAPGCKAF